MDPAFEHDGGLSHKFYQTGFRYGLSGTRHSQLEVFTFRAQVGEFLETSGFSFECFEPVKNNMPPKVTGSKGGMEYVLGFSETLWRYHPERRTKPENHVIHVKAHMPPDSEVPLFLKDLRDYLLSRPHLVKETLGAPHSFFV